MKRRTTIIFGREGAPTLHVIVRIFCEKKQHSLLQGTLKRNIYQKENQGITLYDIPKLLGFHSHFLESFEQYGSFHESHAKSFPP